jgi:uncharacterized membrane protein
MPEMVPADDPPVAAEPVGGRSALERILFGPLPAALIIIEALAVETRRGVNQIAAAGCTTACHGVPTRLSFLKGATVVLAVAAFLMVWRYWRQHLGPRRPAGTVALAALMFFTITAAIAPWWGLAAPISLLALLVAIVAYQAAAGEADELSFPGVLRLRGVRIAVVVIVIYALFLLVIPQSSPQAIDAMLAWASHPTYVFIGVASAVLLALVVHDSALLLVHPAERAEPVVAEGRSRSAISERAALLVAGVAGVLVLVVLAFYSYVAVYGVVFAAVLVGLLAMTHRLPSGALEKDEFDERLRRQVAAWLRLIAEIPLVLFGAAVTLALVEAVLGGDAGGSAWLILALALVVGGLALLERGERDDPYDAEKPAPVFDRPALLQTQWWASIFATVAAADRYPQDTHRVGIAGVALVAAVGLLGLHLWKRQHWPESAQRTRSWLILRYLGVVPLIALPVGELAGRPGAGLIVSVVVIATAFASRLVGRTPREAWEALLASARGRGLGLPIARGAGIALLLGALLDVERTSSIVGTIAAVNLAAAAAIATLHSLIARFDGWSFPERRLTQRAHIANHGVPILLFLTAWVVAVFLFEPPASHRMQVMAAFGTPPLAIDATMNAFLERPHGAAAGSGPRPIFLIASDGGGARASYWTALLLDCAVAARVPHKAPTGTPCATGRDASVKAQIARASRIFAVSGVSGGGVGLAQYAAALVAGGDRGLPKDWAEDVAGYDMLRAPTTWGVTHDLVAGLLGIHAPDEHCLHVENGRRVDDSLECRLVAALTRDRGNVLADSVGGAGGREPLPEVSLRSVTPTKSNHLPVYIDNATLAGGVARVVVSPLELALHLTNNAEGRTSCGTMRSEPVCTLPPVARARDLVDVLGDNRDMPLMAAATLGARFPIITAPGYVASCNDEGAWEHDQLIGCDEPSSSMSDGGFLENTGLLTIREMLPLVARRIAAENRKLAQENSKAAPYTLYVVEFDNHARKLSDKGEIKSGGGAGTTLLNLTSARDFIEGYARESVISFVGSACFLRVHPTASAAGNAPTGWLLSDDAESGLAQSIQAPSPTYKDVERLVRWMDGTGTNADCAP